MQKKKEFHEKLREGFTDKICSQSFCLNCCCWKFAIFKNNVRYRKKFKIKSVLPIFISLTSPLFLYYPHPYFSSLILPLFITPLPLLSQSSILLHPSLSFHYLPSISPYTSSNFLGLPRPSPPLNSPQFPFSTYSYNPQPLLSLFSPSPTLPSH